MKVLVTGGAGFIGSNVCDMLIARGDSVVAVDNFDPYYNIEYKENNVKNLLKDNNFSLHRIDIRDRSALKKIFNNNKIDKIIHLAAKAGVRPSLTQPQLYYDVNISGTLNLLELARDNKIKSVVFASSSSVYGDRDKGPFSEKDDVDNPISPYAATKKAGEELCYVFHHLYDMKITCLRFFTVYGPRGRPDMAIFKFTKLISEGKSIEQYGDGSSERDYTFVLDIVAGIISALDKELSYEILNLGNSNPVKLNHLISTIEGNLNKKAKIVTKPMQPGDVSITFADISKAKKMIDYNPNISIEEGIAQFILWFKKQKY